MKIEKKVPVVTVEDYFKGIVAGSMVPCYPDSPFTPDLIQRLRINATLTKIENNLVKIAETQEKMLNFLKEAK